MTTFYFYEHSQVDDKKNGKVSTKRYAKPRGTFHKKQKTEYGDLAHEPLTLQQEQNWMNEWTSGVAGTIRYG